MQLVNRLCSSLVPKAGAAYACEASLVVTQWWWGRWCLELTQPCPGTHRVCPAGCCFFIWRLGSSAQACEVVPLEPQANNATTSAPENKQGNEALPRL